MISEFTMKPKPANDKPKYFVIVFLVLAAALMVLYFFLDLYRGVIGLVAVISICVAVFFYTTYLTRSYLYDIAIYDNVPLFIVRAKTGKKETTLCRIELRSIVKVEEQNAAERKAHATPRDYAKYKYCPTFAPDRTYLITSVTRYEKAEITIEATPEFAALLTDYAKIAREQYASYEDEEE